MTQLDTIDNVLELETYLSAVAEAATRHLRRAKTPQWKRETLQLAAKYVRVGRVAVCEANCEAAWDALTRAQRLLHVSRKLAKVELYFNS